MSIEMATEIGNGLGRSHCKLVQVIEYLVNTVDGRVRLQAFRVFAEGLKFILLLQVFLDIARFYIVLVTHNKKKHWASEATRFIELKFGKRTLVWIAFGTFGNLAVFVADDANICRTVPYHLERRVDDITVGLCRIILHDHRFQLLPIDGFNQCGPMLDEVGESAGDHDAFVVPWGWVVICHNVFTCSAVIHTQERHCLARGKEEMTTAPFDAIPLPAPAPGQGRRANPRHSRSRR